MESQYYLRGVYSLVLVLIACLPSLQGQDEWDSKIHNILAETLLKHRDFVALPNVASDIDGMFKNIEWVVREFRARGFDIDLLESSTLPVFLAKREISPDAKTILFYMHLDGQQVNPENWDQEHPFKPVLKAERNGQWEQIKWTNVAGEIDPEWRIFGRAAADDKGPIMMMLTALRLLDESDVELKYNVKIVLDLQEEAGSDAFLSTLEKYKAYYAADYMIIMDGPAHPSNKPTLTFGCRGIATCNITVYGAKLPQHSGHYGNYAPNPVFTMGHLLASMKDETGRVVIDGYYDGIDLTADVQQVLRGVPDDDLEIQKGLGIVRADAVGNSYQESLQYPSLNVRHIETSWKGPGLKTMIPEYVTAHIDVRLVAETETRAQVAKVKRHIEKEGYYVLDREPTDQERLTHPRIAKFVNNRGVNAFRTELDSEIGVLLTDGLTKAFGETPVRIRTMGGTIPIIPAINTLEVPAIIVPMVNMDNNQHNPNENLRIGNMIDGIKMCMVILSMEI